MRRRVRPILLVLLLAGPFVLAFFAGGYFDQPRLFAGLGACALVVAAALVSPRPLPASGAGRLALGGLALLAAWTAASIAWAPLSTRAVADTDRLLLYLAAFAAALAILDTRRYIRALEPVLALGALVVVGYGLSERVLPGVVRIAHDASAFGRLSRPLTYWNAMGTVAALGLVVAARVAGDTSRPRALRALAAAAAAPLGLGLYLTFSRGALAACAVGILLLALLDRRGAQLKAIGVAIAAAGIAAAAGGASAAVRQLAGTPSSREGAGAATLALLVVTASAAALVQLWLARRERPAGDDGRVIGRGGQRALAGALAAVVVGAFVLAAVSSERRPAAAPTGASASRLASVQSNRSDYWRVALDMFAAHPLKGSGSGGFAVDWLRKRKVREGVLDAHSLYLETPAELGIVGLAALLLFLGGVAWGASRAYARDPVAAVGLAAALAVWLVHAGLDWIWEMPTVSLPMLILAAALIRLAESPAAPYGRTGGATERIRVATTAAAPGS